ncbi:hypothetical protein Droror1_Dr00017716, partial [Drosera rotundifolia]
MGCFHSKRVRPPGYEEPVILSAETPFTVSEVDALFELFKKLSSSIVDDGLIHRLKEMVLALLHESDLVLFEEAVEMIVDKTLSDADLKGDGRIDPEEWKEFVFKNPSLVKNMTLPYL